ncbi:MAG: hypothetical protein WA765_07935 [Candidatus Acidiferrum sp.]
MEDKRPLSVTIIAWVYIAVGVAGFVFYFTQLHGASAFQLDGLLVELVRFLAIVAGIFMLRGRNWARWLAIVWIVFHVGLSAFHPWRELAVHSVLFVVFAWCLYHPGARRYFRGARN